jgi:hypothetical protein
LGKSTRRTFDYFRLTNDTVGPKEPFPEEDPHLRLLS